MARPIWDYYMQKVYADTLIGIEKGPFPKPIRKLSVEIDCAKYQNPELAEMDSVDLDLKIDKLDQDEIY